MIAMCYTKNTRDKPVLWQRVSCIWHGVQSRTITALPVAIDLLQDDPLGQSSARVRWDVPPLPQYPIGTSRCGILIRVWP